MHHPGDRGRLWAEVAKAVAQHRNYLTGCEQTMDFATADDKSVAGEQIHEIVCSKIVNVTLVHFQRQQRKSDKLCAKIKSDSVPQIVPPELTRGEGCLNRCAECHSKWFSASSVCSAHSRFRLERSVSVCNFLRTKQTPRACERKDQSANTEASFNPEEDRTTDEFHVCLHPSSQVVFSTWRRDPQAALQDKRKNSPCTVPT